MDLKLYLNKIITTALLLLMVPCIIYAAEKKNVLILNSYHQGYKWTDDEVRGIVNGLFSGLLHFFRRHARRLENDLGLDGRNIGKGVDGDARSRIRAGEREKHGRHHGEHALRQGEPDKSVQHRVSLSAQAFRGGQDR